MMCVASGDAILEGPTVQAGRNHRFVVVHGEWVVIDGCVRWWGLTRNAKDAQRSYNVTRTSITETIATSPNTHFWATHKQAEGNTDQWAQMHKRLYPFGLYNTDPQAPGAPQRMGGPDVPVALIQEMQIADQELKDVTGVYDAALGERSNEKSGVAISRREQQTQLVNYNYPDNMSKGVKRTWEILIDLIPEIYDTERIVRVIGADGAEDYVKVNTSGVDPQTGEPTLINDLTRGKYDVTVTVGPSFATQRQEASESYGQMVQGMPQILGVAGDLIFKAMDLPYSDQIAERMQALLPPQIQQQLSKGKNIPPEVAQAMTQVNQAMEAVKQQGQLVQQAAGEAEQKKAEAEKAASQVESVIEKLKTEEARFEAQVAKAQAMLAQREAQLAVQEVQATLQPQQADLDGQRQEFMQSAQATLQGVQDLVQQFIAHAAQTVSAIDQRAAQPPAPRQRVARMKRVNGELVGTIDDMNPDGSVAQSRPVNVSRQNGELVGTMQ
jgi:hypothetical protein